jgi:hypothetical protein
MIELHSEPVFAGRGWEAANYVTPEGEPILHERTYWRRFGNSRHKTMAELAHVVFGPEPIVEYWVTQQIYKSLSLAELEAKKYKFRVQKSFYCDDNDPDWFPIFDDADKALAFINDKGNRSFVFEKA